MKILVFSDSHGQNELMSDIIIRLYEKIDMVLFLGDCIDDFIDFQFIFPNKKFFYVSGNCDFYHDAPSEQIIEAAGKKIFMTHGHRYSVKQGLEKIMNEARRHGADICLYGHSHFPNIVCENGIHLMNPGSISLPRGTKYPSYGVIEVKNNKISLEIFPVL